MARKIKIKIICPICEEEFETFKYEIRQGDMKGVIVMDNVFCSDKCKKKFKTMDEITLVNEEAK